MEFKKITQSHEFSDKSKLSLYMDDLSGLSKLIYSEFLFWVLRRKRVVVTKNQDDRICDAIQVLERTETMIHRHSTLVEWMNNEFEYTTSHEIDGQNVQLIKKNLTFIGEHYLLKVYLNNNIPHINKWDLTNVKKGFELRMGEVYDHIHELCETLLSEIGKESVENVYNEFHASAEDSYYESLQDNYKLKFVEKIQIIYVVEFFKTFFPEVMLSPEKFEFSEIQNTLKMVPLKTLTAVFLTGVPDDIIQPSDQMKLRDTCYAILSRKVESEKLPYYTSGKVFEEDIEHEIKDLDQQEGIYQSTYEGFISEVEAHCYTTATVYVAGETSQVGINVYFDPEVNTHVWGEGDNPYEFVFFLAQIGMNVQNHPDTTVVLMSVAGEQKGMAQYDARGYMLNLENGHITLNRVPADLLEGLMVLDNGGDFRSITYL